MNISSAEHHFQPVLGRSACAAVHTCYAVDACDRVQSIILLSGMATSFVLHAKMADCQ